MVITQKEQDNQPEDPQIQILTEAREAFLDGDIQRARQLIERSNIDLSDGETFGQQLTNTLGEVTANNKNFRHPIKSQGDGEISEADDFAGKSFGMTPLRHLEKNGYAAILAGREGLLDLISQVAAEKKLSDEAVIAKMFQLTEGESLTISGLQKNPFMESRRGGMRLILFHAQLFEGRPIAVYFELKNDSRQESWRVNVFDRDRPSYDLPHLSIELDDLSTGECIGILCSFCEVHLGDEINIEGLSKNVSQKALPIEPERLIEELDIAVRNKILPDECSYTGQLQKRLQWLEKKGSTQFPSSWKAIDLSHLSWKASVIKPFLRDYCVTIEEELKLLFSEGSERIGDLLAAAKNGESYGRLQYVTSSPLGWNAGFHN